VYKVVSLTFSPTPVSTSPTVCCSHLFYCWGEYIYMDVSCIICIFLLLLLVWALLTLLLLTMVLDIYRIVNPLPSVSISHDDVPSPSCLLTISLGPLSKESVSQLLFKVTSKNPPTHTWEKTHSQHNAENVNGRREREMKQ